MANVEPCPHKAVAGAGEADTEEAQRGVQREGSAAAIRGDRPVASKTQLLDDAASVFKGSASGRESSNEARVDVLYRQISQKTVENEFWHGTRVPFPSRKLVHVRTYQISKKDMRWQEKGGGVPLNQRRMDVLGP
jgi:hypothetical protein